MIHFDESQDTDKLAHFTDVPDPARSRACVVALAEPETRLALAGHMEQLGYEVWTAATGLDAHQLCLDFHERVDVLVCDENLPDLPPLVLFGHAKARQPGLQCCVLASVEHWPGGACPGRSDGVMLDVVGWRAGMLFVRALVPNK